jgi:hypothetical protein
MVVRSGHGYGTCRLPALAAGGASDRRIDIHIDVPAVKFKELARDTPALEFSRNPSKESRSSCVQTV